MNFLGSSLASWLAEHRQYVIYTVAGIAVVLPLLIGITSRRVPRHMVIGWFLPLAASTAVLVVSLRLIEQWLEPGPRFLLAICFGGFWMAVGAYTVLVLARRRPVIESAAPAAIRAIGIILLLFGALWVALSRYRFDV